jgi:hypothetical protein
MKPSKKAIMATIGAGESLPIKGEPSINSDKRPRHQLNRAGFFGFCGDISAGHPINEISLKHSAVASDDPTPSAGG